MNERWIAALSALALGACSGPIPTGAAAAPAADEEPAGDEVVTEERAEPSVPVFALSGFSTPESIVHDAEDDVYLVANVQGSPVERDENGFISKVSPDGELIEAQFIRGGAGSELSAPKGMAIAGDLLHVADIDRVYTFHRQTGELVREVKVPGATFLNGVAVGPEGEVYVTDSGLTLGDAGFAASGTDAVYVLREDYEPEAIVRDPSLGRPNGILHTEDGLWVVTFGTGELYRIDAEGEIRDRRTLEVGTLDGIVALRDGSVAVSSWEGESVLVGDLRGVLETTIRGVESPAAIGVDLERGRVLVPLFMRDEVRAYVLQPRAGGVSDL